MPSLAEPSASRLIGIIMLGNLPLALLAFWPLYLSRPSATVDGFTHLHAFAGTLWLFLLVLQPIAIYRRKFDLHRALGKLSYVAAPLFVVAVLLLSHYRLSSMTDETFAIDGPGHYLPFYAAVVFATSYVLGLRFRWNSEAHARFMICTAIPIVDPVIGRLMFFYLPVLPSPRLYQVTTFGFASAAAAYLVFSYRGPAKPRRALVGYFVFLVVMELGWFTVSLTPQWLQAVGWFRSLPLP